MYHVSRECAACNPPTYSGVLDLHDFWGQRQRQTERSLFRGMFRRMFRYFWSV